MDYSNSHYFQSHPTYNGMVRVLPTTQPSFPEPLTPFKKQRSQFLSSPDLSRVSPRQLPYPYAVHASNVPKLPPPPENPRLALKRINSINALNAVSTHTVNTGPFINNRPMITGSTQFATTVAPSRSFSAGTAISNGHALFTGHPQNGNIRTSTEAVMKMPSLQKDAPVFFPSSPNARSVASNSYRPKMAESKPSKVGNDSGFDYDKLREEIAQLTREVASMNEQMKEEDVWIEQQSEQVKELAKQQLQLQTNMNISKTRQFNEYGKGSRPPLPTSPRPTSQQLQISSKSPSSSVSVLCNSPLKTVENSKMKHVTEKSVSTSTPEAEIHKVTGVRTPAPNLNVATHKPNIANIPPKPSIFTPEKSYNSSSTASTVSVKRISGLFENGSVTPATRVETSTNKQSEIVQNRLSTSTNVFKTAQKLSPKPPTSPADLQNRHAGKLPPTENKSSEVSVSAETSLQQHPKNFYEHTQKPTPFTDRSKSSDIIPSNLSKTPPPLSPRPPVSPKLLLQTSMFLRSNAPRMPPSQAAQSLPLSQSIYSPKPYLKSVNSQLPEQSKEESSKVNDSSTTPTPPPMPTSEPPTEEAHISGVPSSQLSTINDDIISVSSLSSTSSYYSPTTRSLTPDSNEMNSIKADLMEQIRQVGKSGLRKTASLDNDSSKFRSRGGNEIQDALQSRFEAFCGSDSDSGEGESEGDSDNWDD